MRLSALRVLTICCAIYVGIGLVWAHSGATGIVKERMDVMDDIGKMMKSIAAMAKGEITFDGVVISETAMKIADHSGQFARLFPEGTNAKPSEALPAIWSNWDEFLQIADKLKSSASELAETSRTATGIADIRTELVAVGATCRGCHDKFRLAK